MCKDLGTLKVVEGVPEVDGDGGRVRGAELEGRLSKVKCALGAA